MVPGLLDICKWSSFHHSIFGAAAICVVFLGAFVRSQADWEVVTAMRRMTEALRLGPIDTGPVGRRLRWKQVLWSIAGFGTMLAGGSAAVWHGIILAECRAPVVSSFSLSKIIVFDALTGVLSLVLAGYSIYTMFRLGPRER